MRAIEILIVGAIWIAAGVLGAGWVYADIRHEDVDTQSEAFWWAAFFAVAGGPVALVMGPLLSGFGRHGWWIWSRRKAERLEENDK